MDSAQLIVAFMGAGGGGAVALALVTGIIKWISGASGRERARNTDLVSQRVKAVEERDAAIAERDNHDVRRRQTAEYASRLRRQLMENGITPEPWPDLEKTLTPAQLRHLRKPMKE